ncbi:MAG: nitrous oxide-stimulated promoter family protein [Bacteroides sp.]
MKEVDKTHRAQEKKTVERMIRLYCRKKEKNTVLCPACEELLRYACTRLDRCPFGEKKGSCRKCSVHCYQPAMRQRMREVMRFSGPRMFFYAPLATIRHLLP